MIKKPLLDFFKTFPKEGLGHFLEKIVGLGLLFFPCFVFFDVYSKSSSVILGLAFLIRFLDKKQVLYFFASSICAFIFQRYIQYQLVLENMGALEKFSTSLTFLFSASLFYSLLHFAKTKFLLYAFVFSFLFLSFFIPLQTFLWHDIFVFLPSFMAILAVCLSFFLKPITLPLKAKEICFYLIGTISLLKLGQFLILLSPMSAAEKIFFVIFSLFIVAFLQSRPSSFQKWTVLLILVLYGIIVQEKTNILALMFSYAIFWASAYCFNIFFILTVIGTLAYGLLVAFHFGLILNFYWIQKLGFLVHSFYERILLWKKADQIFKAHLSPYRAYEALHTNIVYTDTIFSATPIERSFIPIHCHNLFLQMKMMFGLKGLFLMTLICLAFLMKIFQIKDPYQKHLALATFIYIMILGLTGYPILTQVFAITSFGVIALFARSLKAFEHD